MGTGAALGQVSGEESKSHRALALSFAARTYRVRSGKMARGGGGGGLILRRAMQHALRRSNWVIIPEHRRNCGACIHSLFTYHIPPYTTFSPILLLHSFFWASLLHKWYPCFPYQIQYAPPKQPLLISSPRLPLETPKTAVALGPSYKISRRGEVMTPQSQKYGIIPYTKPKNKDHPRWQAKYNDGHSFIWDHGEHPFAQLYTWPVCRDPSKKLGMSWEQSLICREEWCQQTNMHGFLVFWCLFP